MSFRVSSSAPITPCLLYDPIIVKGYHHLGSVPARIPQGTYFTMLYTDSAVAPHFVDAWKRAILRRAPNHFRLKTLPPEKQGSSYSYGFRIYPIRTENSSMTTHRSSSGESLAPVDEYDIWRRWEDCLLFQENLETAYSLAAREKRNRLAAGKGVKKNGVYVHSDQAASWESLPFGPDPNDIAYDIHQHVPKLSKKGMLFRTSQETIDNRYQNLRVMMQALFQDDLPTLIKEIKATDTFTDFFGVWKRDIDLAGKAQSKSLKKPSADRPRTSLSSSILSAFPVSSGSRPSKSSSLNKGKAPEKVQSLPPPSTHSDSSSEDAVDLSRPSRLMARKVDIRSMGSRASSTGSQSSSSPSTPISVSRQLSPASRQPIIASQDVPIKFGHNPHVLGSERSGSFNLASLPEDRELSSPPKSDMDGLWLQGRSKVNCNTRICIPSSSESSDPSSRSLSRYSRASLLSTHSSATLRAAAYLDELDVDYCLPSPIPEPRHHPRASVSSVASLVTNSSVDAVIPHGERPARSANTPRPLFLAEKPQGEYEPWSEDDSDDHDDLLDAYFYDMISPLPQTPTGYPETPTVDDTMYHFAREQSKYSTTLSSYYGYSDRRSSWTTSISSGSTSSTGSGDPTMIFIKATHENDIVLLRLPRNITFDGLRRKIYERFIQTDKSTICESFAIALVEQGPTEISEDGRRSMSSLVSSRSKGSPLHFISSQDEWNDVAATHHSKMFLRIIGSRE